MQSRPHTRQLTHAPQPHVLTNVNTFSADGEWIAYDVRSRSGEAFDGDRIERVNVATGERQVLYTARDGAKVGVVTCNPAADEYVFIHGPTNPTPEFAYGVARRQGVIVNAAGQPRNLDARDLVAPFTPGALRGGTHVHVFSDDGAMVSSTYEDHVLDTAASDVPHDRNLRTIAVSVLGKPVHVDQAGPRDHDGVAFTVVVARTVDEPAPGSDEINKAIEEGWVGTDGYVRDTNRPRQRALAFQGNVITADGETISEVFIVDLPDDLTRAGAEPIEGTSTRRPAPPAGCVQRRLTFTADRKFPGIQGPRHWLRSAPDGSQIAFLMKDDAGVVQLWTVSPTGGPPRQVTRNATPITSAFTWSPDGRSIAHAMDGAICVTDVSTGRTTPVTERFAAEQAPRPQACVFSPDGRRIAFVRPTTGRDGAVFDQIWVVELPSRQRLG